MDNEDTVHQAVKVLYCQTPGEPKAKEEASLWLAQFQKSIHAWTVSDKLLHQKRDLETSYFAAHTMRSKVLYAFHELPAESYASLRESLLQHLLACPSPEVDTSQIIQKQLSLALVDLALQMPGWSTTVITDLQNALAQTVPHAYLTILLFFPEEVQSPHLRLGANTRFSLTRNLVQHLPNMLTFLEMAAQQSAGLEPVMVQIFRCLASWLQLHAAGAMPDFFGPNAMNLAQLNGHIASIQQIPKTPLLAQAFQVAAAGNVTGNLHDAATDCISKAIACLPICSRIDADFANFIFTSVHGLIAAFHAFVAAEDLDKVMNTGRLFIELGESLVEFLVQSPGQGFGDFLTVDRILDVIGYHDYALADMSFNFWYRFSEFIYTVNVEMITLMYIPHVKRLLLILYRHACLDPDHVGVPEECPETAEFRLHVSECIRDVAFIPGSKAIFSDMFEHLKSLGPSATWEQMEGALFVMASIAKNVVPVDDEVVPPVVDGVLELSAVPTAHIAVKSTGLHLFTELDEWVSEHEAYISKVLAFAIAMANSDPALTPVASRALDRLATRCAGHLGGHLNELSNLLMKSTLSQDAALSILRAIASIVSRMESSQATEHLRQLCMLQIEPLIPLINKADDQQPSTKCSPNDENSAPAANANGLRRDDPIVWLDRLANIFRQIDSSSSNNNIHHPVLPVIEQVWPVLSAAAQRYIGQERIEERVCRCIRFVIRCGGRQLHRILEDLVNLIMRLYGTHPHSCLIYLGSILVDEYANDPAFVPGLLIMTEAFQTRAFELIKSTGLEQQPNTVDDLYRLGLRFVEKAPGAFAEWAKLPPFYEMGIGAICIQHSEANESVCRFYSGFIAFAASLDPGRLANKDLASGDQAEIIRGKEVARKLIVANGQRMVHTILHAAVYSLPPHVIRYPAEVLFHLGQLDMQQFGGWLNSGLGQVNSGTVRLTEEQLTTFQALVLSASEWKKICHGLRDFSRLYH